MDKCLIIPILFTISIIFQYEVIAESSLEIINGTTADKGEFPYMCGGTILGPEWVLTAGNCWDENGGDDVDAFAILYGTNHLFDYDSGNSIPVEQRFKHPNFTAIGSPEYDVGILKLTNPMSFSKYASPIKLPDIDDEVPFHTQGVLSGWGSDQEMFEVMHELQKVDLELLTDEECTKAISDYSGKDSFNPTQNLCSDDYMKGACYWDTGDPFVINGTQYGIFSWRYTPCGPAPGVYSRLTNSETREWIRSITGI